MPLLMKVRQLAVKVETTIGTDASVGNSDVAFNAWDIVVQGPTEMAPREAQSCFGNLASIAGPFAGKATFKTDMNWLGSTTEPSWASILLPACGWVASGTDPTVFSPTAEAPGSNVKTVTIAQYGNGKLKKLVGAMGTFKMHLEPGKMQYIEWEFMGSYSDDADASMLTQTAATGTSMRFASATALTWNSVAWTGGSYVIDAGNKLTAIEDATKESGIKNYLVVDRLPKITAAPEAVLVATQDRWTAWKSASEYALAVTLDAPGTTGGTLAIAAPKAQIISLQEGNRNGVVTDEIELQCNKNGSTTNSELTFTFTANT